MLILFCCYGRTSYYSYQHGSSIACPLNACYFYVVTQVKAIPANKKCNISEPHGFWQIPSLINEFFILHKSESSFTSLNWTLIKTNFTSHFDTVLSYSTVIQGLRLSWLIPLLSNEALGCRGWSLVSSITVSVQWHGLHTLFVVTRKQNHCKEWHQRCRNVRVIQLSWYHNKEKRPH